MTLSNRQLYSNFESGATRGQANRMAIKQVRDLDRVETEIADPDDTVVVAYGWAIYAHRAQDGTITVFDGWADWAIEVGNCADATPRHISSLATYADRTINATPQCDDKPTALVRQLKSATAMANRF